METNDSPKLSTYKLELLNALAFIVWASLLLYGLYKGEPRRELQIVTPLSAWIATLYLIAALQITGVLFGLRVCRALAATFSGILLASLVWNVARKGLLYPFVPFGSVWAIGQYISLYHIVSAQTIKAVFGRYRKEVTEDGRHEGGRNSDSTSSGGADAFSGV